MLGSALRAPAALFAAIFVLSGISVALYPLNYGAYAAFMTATFVLLAEMEAQSWHLALVRLANNLIGALLALIGALVLWPGRERPREALATAVRAVRNYLGEVLRRPHDPTAPTLTVARRHVNIARANAHTALQRLLMERARDDAAVEALMAVLGYARRLAVSITALAVVSEERALHEGVPPWVETFERGVATVLDQAAEDLVAARAPVGGDELARVRGLVPERAHGAIVAGAERVARQLVVLRAAVGRAVTAR